MSNLHRIAWFDAQVRAGRYPNARTLAGHFEISTRQAARDIEYLRYSLGAPLQYDHGKRGFVYEGEAFTLPGVFVTEAQREDLQLLSDRYGQLPEARSKHLGKLFSQLVAATYTHRDRSSEEGHLFAYSLEQERRHPIEVEVEFAIQEIVDWSGMQAERLDGGKYLLRVASHEELLLFLLKCEGSWQICSPHWLKIRLRKLVEKTLHNLSQ